MVELNIDERLGTAYVKAPFDDAKALLNEKGYRIISLEENVQLRMQEGKGVDISRYGNWTREGFVYVPNKGVYLVRNSPILEEPVKATNAHRKIKDFYLTKKQVEKALEDSVLLPFKSLIFIPTNRFGEDDITTFAFGEQAKAYGEFLKEAGIEQMPIWLANKQSKPFARQLWFDSLGLGSGLDCYGRDLYFDVRLLGVRKDAEGIKKTSLPKKKPEEEKLIFINPFEVDIPEFKK